ncbi:MAG: polysaccharide biosynthesis C-terminal domain-containing protein [Planctomycetota bacterium]
MSAKAGGQPESGGQAGRPESIGGLLRHTSIYAIAPLFQRALALILVRFYTEALGAGGWGLVSLMDLFVALLPLIVGTSLVAGLSRHYFVHEDPRDRSSVVSGTALALLTTSLIGVGVVILFREQVAGLIFAARGDSPPAEFVGYVVIAACVVPFALMTRVGIESFQVEKRSKTVVSITVSKALFESALKLIFLFVLDLGVQGFLLAVLTGEAVTGTLLFIHVARKHGLRIDGRTFKPLLMYTLPLAPVGLFQLGLHQADRLLIRRLGPQEVIGQSPDGAPISAADTWVGIYALGYQIPLLLHTAAIASFMRIWKVSLFGLKDESVRREELLRVGRLVALGLAALYSLLAVFGREAVHMLAGKPELRAGAEVVPWITTAYLGYALFALSQASLLSVFATGPLALINLIALTVNIGLNFALIPVYGYLGAAMATLASFLLLAALAFQRSTAIGAQPYPPLHAAAALVVVALAGMSGRVVDGSTEAWSIPALAIKGVVALLLAALLFSLLPSEQRASLRAKLQARFGG